jgi:WW domain-containing oxidoreductase
MSLIEHIIPKGSNGFGYGTTAEQVSAGLSLAGKTMLVTGCNSGLGLETMRVLALRGAHVIGTARSVDKARAACESVAGHTSPLACELAEPSSVRACVDAVKQQAGTLDAIICNAGIMALPKLQKAYGYELQFFTNHIGHFLLVTGLLDRLSDTGRVVMLSSTAHAGAPRGGIQFDNLDGSKGYSAWKNYGQSKFANLLFAKELSRRLTRPGQSANALHPGVINTNLLRHMGGISRRLTDVVGPLFLKTPEQGAATSVYVATNPGLTGVSGQYFADCNIARPRADANDEATAKKLWEVSEKIAAELA